MAYLNINIPTVYAKVKKEYDWPVVEKRWLALAKVWEERKDE